MNAVAYMKLSNYIYVCTLARLNTAARASWIVPMKVTWYYSVTTCGGIPKLRRTILQRGCIVLRIICLLRKLLCDIFSIAFSLYAAWDWDLINQHRWVYYARLIDYRFLQAYRPEYILFGKIRRKINYKDNYRNSLRHKFHLERRISINGDKSILVCKIFDNGM